MTHTFCFIWQKCNHNTVIIITTWRWQISWGWKEDKRLEIFSQIFCFMYELTNYLMWSCKNVPILIHLTQWHIIFFAWRKWHMVRRELSTTYLIIPASNKLWLFIVKKLAPPVETEGSSPLISKLILSNNITSHPHSLNLLLSTLLYKRCNMFHVSFHTHKKQLTR